MSIFKDILNVLRLQTEQLPFETKSYQIPSIGAAAAYATGDAFGEGFWVTLPKKGIIDGLTFIDLDNEGIAKTIYLFRKVVNVSADNAVFTPVASDMVAGSPIQINLTASDYVTHSGGRLATVTSIGLPYEAPEGRLWCRLVTRGVDNIAAGASPYIFFSGRQR